MKNKNSPTQRPSQNTILDLDTTLEGYPPYPPSQDIYNQFKEEMDIDPENILEPKALNEDDVSGDDLDVPNSEADDTGEAIGSEDEENNYYSIGGDNHKDLEEAKAE
jgi:hypothetical protein